MPTVMSINRTKACWMFTVLVLVAGCEGSTTVTGTVTYNGKPVEDGYISFRPAGGQGQAFAAQITDGHYSAKQAVPGLKIVVVSGTKEVDFYASSEENYRRADEARKSGAADVGEATDYIAENAEGNSQKHEIESGNQTIDFAVTGSPRS